MPLNQRAKRRTTRVAAGEEHAAAEAQIGEDAEEEGAARLGADAAVVDGSAFYCIC
jgi:hypothetical protein